MQKVRSQDGTEIAFERFGEGPPIVFVSGAIQHRAIDPAGSELCRLLGERFTVAYHDRRGRGDSGDTQPYAVEREIEDISAVIDALGGSASLFGGSSGAVLALEAAAHGLPVPKLAMYEPPFVVDDTRPPVPEDYLEQYRRFSAEGRLGDAVAYFMTAGVGMPDEVVAGMRGQPFWAPMEQVGRTLEYDATFMSPLLTGSVEPLKKWASVPVPTLVMDGGNSPAWMRNATRAIVDVLPNVRHRTLEGQTHEVAPDAIAPVLIEFFGD